MTQGWSTGAVRVGRGNVFDFTAPATEEWMGHALCAQVDLEVFFPPKGGSTLEAKTTCGMCWVQEECLTYALANNEPEGIWGGLSPKQRRRLTTVRRRIGRADLEERSRAVQRLRAVGRSQRQIAVQLGISHSSVQKDLKRVVPDLDVAS